MSTFNPQVDEIRSEQPVSSPSYVQGLAGVFAGLASSGRKPIRPSERDQDVALNEGLVRALRKAEIERQNGNDVAARRIETNARVNYTKLGGDIQASDTQDMISTITGRPAEFLGQTDTQAAALQLRESPEYTNAVAASFMTNPDATDEERSQMALATVAMSKANEAMIINSTFNWNASGEQAALSLVSQSANGMMGLLAIAAKEGVQVGVEDVEAANARWLADKASLMAALPSNIPAASKQKIEAQINIVDEQLKFLTKAASLETLNEKVMLEAVSAIQQVEGVTPVITASLLKMIERSPESFAGVSDLMGVYKSASKYMAKGVDASTPDPEDIDNPLPASMAEAYEGIEPSEAFENAKNLSSVTNGTDKSLITSSPEVRKDWANNLFAGLHNISKISENEDWLEASSYRRMLTPKMLENIESVKNVDPALHERLTKALSQTVQTNLIAVSANIRSANNEFNPFRYNADTDDFEFSREKFIADFPANEKDKLAFINGLDSLYEGDFEALTKDNGSKFSRSLDTLDLGRSQEEKGRERAAFDVWRTMSLQLNSNQLSKALEARRFLSTMKDRVETMLPQEPRDESFIVEDIPLADLIDETEGAGEYDTLFNFSQKEGGQFSEVDVTNMTLGELKDFTDPNGDYGQWVASQNNGTVATPMGRYQIVGTTLKRVQEALNLPDEQVFDRATQDQMFVFLANERLKGKSSMSAKRRALRNEWHGFRNVSDEELDRAIIEYEKS